MWVLRRLTWGRNPMCRPGDRLEWAAALTIVLLSLLAVPVSAAVGTATQTRHELAALEQQANGLRATAVLLEDVPKQQIGPTGFVEPQPAVKATWTQPDGTPRTAPITATPGAKAGDRVVVWLNESGAPTQPPMRPGDIALSAVLTAVFVLVMVEVCLCLAYALIRALLDRARMAQWHDEWERVEPAWRRRGELWP
ncbi:Rv1733c family protein [Flindersiella endophytica]